MYKLLAVVAAVLVLFILALGPYAGIDGYKPRNNTSVNYEECAIQQCHGPDYTCGPVAEPLVCTLEYRLGDRCGQYFSCAVVAGGCQAQKELEFELCARCAKQCDAGNCTGECYEFFKQRGDIIEITEDITFPQ